MATPDEINAEFYAGYGDQPRGMTLLDYLSPSSYVDPYKSLRNPQQVAPQMDEKGFRQLSQAEAKMVYDNPRYNPNLSANAQYDQLFGGNQSQGTNRVSMPNMGSLTDYIPSASSIGKYIPTSLPNVFGQENPLYAGLLGADQSKALSRQSNIAGLLGAAAALAQGMSSQGSRRSGFQNVINSLGAGYGSAGQAYQQGLQTYGQAQQLALQQRQQAGIQAMKMKYPDLADEFDTNPAGAFRIVSEREAAERKPTVVSEGGTLVSPKGEVLYSSTKNKPQARVLTGDEITQLGLPTASGQKYQIGADGKIDLIQGTASEKPESFSGDFGNLSLKMFGTANVAKLTEQQRIALGKEAERLGVGKGQSVTTNVYPAGAVPLGKEGANKVDTQLLDLGQSRLNLQSIASGFNPKYLQTPFKLKMAAVAEGEKIGIKPDAQTAAELADYSKFTQDSYTQLNNYINQITGAAVGSGDEEKRLRKGIPDPQKDSPTEFVTKLKAKIQEGRLYEARLGYIKQNGMKITDVDVNKIPTLMREREAKIKSNNSLFGNKEYNPKDVNHQAIVRSILSREFGLME